MKKSWIIIVSIFLSTSVIAQVSGDCWPGFRGDRKLSGTSNAELTKKQPKLLWTFQTGDEIKSSPVICDDLIYIASMNGKVACLNAKGDSIWEYNAGSTSFEAPILLLDGILYANSLDGFIHALDAKTGEKKWIFETEGQLIAACNWTYDLSKSKNVILVGSYDYYLYCLDARTGALEWKYESDNYINGAVAINNKHAVFGGCDAILHVVDVQTGKESGRYDLGTYIASSASISKNVAFIGDYDGSFSGINLNNMSLKWKYEPENEMPFLSSAAIWNNKVVVGSQDKRLYCFDFETGQKEWVFQTRGKLDGSPVIADNKVITASWDGNLYCVSLETGKIFWSFEIGSAMFGTPAVTDKIIAIGARDGNIYVLENK